MKFKYWMSLLLMVFSLSLISCGDSGGGDGDGGGGDTFSGSESEAEVTSDNSDELAIAATGGIEAAINQDLAPARSSKVQSLVLETTKNLVQQLSKANRTANQEYNFCDSGSVDYDYNSDFTEYTITYNNCTYSYSGYTATYDGKVYYKENSDGSYTIRYQNFTVEYLGESYTINYTIECDAEYNCTYRSDYSGLDGRTYRVEDAYVSGSGDTYSVSATVYDPDYGYVSMSANITYGSCMYGVPASGSVTVTGSGGSTASITYNDCDSFTVTVNGVATTYYWADLLG